MPAGLLLEAARVFSAGRRGSVTAGTGPNMARRGTLMEYLAVSLQTICGRWLRAGEPVPNPYVLLPQRASRAQADPRKPAWGYGERLRVRNLGENASGLPTAALADEMLLEGEGRVRALFCIGGNPLAAWPDQLKTNDALRSLDLLVTIDPRMSATAQLAHYVIAPRLSLEVDGITFENERVWGYAAATAGYPVPYAQFAPALVGPPEGSELIEEWELFYGLARRLALTLDLDGVAVDMERKPTTDELHRVLTRNSRIPLDEVKKYPHGHVFGDRSIVVEPKEDGWPHRLDVGNELMMHELAEVAAEPILDHAAYRAGKRFAYRLVSRRLRDVYNSSGHDIPHLVRAFTYNPAFMHPHDMADEGLAAGDVIEIDSGHAQILGVVQPAPDIARAVVSMAHAWGGPPEHDAQPRTIGSNTGRLSSVEQDFDPITGIPMMSAIPVNIRSMPSPEISPGRPGSSRP